MSHHQQHIQIAQNNHLNVIEVESASLRQLFVMVKFNVRMLKTRKIAIFVNLDVVLRTRIPVDLANVCLNMSSVMQLFHVVMGLMNHRIYVARA